jgi:hypothetical protein
MPNQENFKNINNEQIESKKENNLSIAENPRQEYSEKMTKILKYQGLPFYEKTVKLTKELQNKYSREELNKHPFYLVLIGGSNWKSNELVEETEDIDEKIKDFLDTEWLEYEKEINKVA